MNIPKEIRYRPYADWSNEEVAKIKQNVSTSPWRSTYHIEPKSGLLNDPNGFSYFNGKYHLFYQNWPFGAAHGLKSWIHTESTDLVHFTETGITLDPQQPNDSHGAYSGSAYNVDDKLFLFYTGNVRDTNWLRTPLQIGAFLTKDGKIKKIEEVLINQPDDVTDHFRDPQIFKYNDNFYALIGGQNKNFTGIIKLYKAINNSVEHWEFVENLHFTHDHSAYMIECPNLVFIHNQPILIYCPQGLDKDTLNYSNIYPNTYKICQTFNPKSATLGELSDIQNLDYGFDCYATQAFNAPDGRALSVSWIGLPDIDYPTDKYDHQGVLSLVKELTVKNGTLYQYPVKAIETLRSTQEPFLNKTSTNNTYELALTFSANSISEIILFADEKKVGFSLTIDTKNGSVIIDRSHVGEQYAIDFGTSRSCPIENKDGHINIFVDISIIEIFINNGEKVFTSRVFPNETQTGIYIVKGNLQGNYFELRY